MCGSQGTPLYSPDGSVFIEILADGTFSLFDSETGNTIYGFSGPTADTNTPLTLTMQAVR